MLDSELDIGDMLLSELDSELDKEDVLESALVSELDIEDVLILVCMPLSSHLQKLVSSSFSLKIFLSLVF